MKINIDIDIENLITNLNKKIEGLEDLAVEAVNQTAFKIQGDARDILMNGSPTRHDTGYLARSINVEEAKSGSGLLASAIVGTDCEYATFVEFGTGIYNPSGRQTPWVYYDERKKEYRFTYGMQGVNFMSTAFNQNKDFLRQYLLSRISKVMGG